MTRRFWAGVMVLAIILTAGSASLIFDRLSEAEPQPVPLTSVPADQAPPLVETSSATVEPINSMPTAPASVEAPEAKPAAATKDTAKRDIPFKLVRPTAKTVAIVGEFNNWMRKPMKKKGKTWETSVSLAPGQYEYAFVVDGKRVRDPNNKQSGPNGKTSVITVKPLGKRS